MSDIERIYRDALNAGNHASALEAVYRAGGGIVSTPYIPEAAAAETVKPPSIVDAIAAADKAEEVATLGTRPSRKAKTFWQPV